MGHGGLRRPSFYQMFAELLIDAQAELFTLKTLFDDLTLAVAVEKKLEGGRKKRHWKTLIGMGGIPSEEPADDATPGHLYFIGRDLQVPLYPLVVYSKDEDEKEHFGFINGVHKKTKKGKTRIRSVEYLDYATGESVPDVDAGEGMADWLARLRGEPASEEDVLNVTRGIEVEEQAAGNAPMPAVIGDRYHVLEPVGQGGIGAVYHVKHMGTGEHLALKVLLPRAGADAATIARFKNEAKRRQRSTARTWCASPMREQPAS